MQLRILLFNIHKNMLQKKCKWLFRIWIVGLVGDLAACDAKDACLDQGGSYNETTKQCEK